MEGAQHGGIGQPSTGFRVGDCPSGLLSCLHSKDVAMSLKYLCTFFVFLYDSV